MKAIVLGSTGMLGHAVLAELKFAGIPTISVARHNADISFDCLTSAVASHSLGIESGDFVVNCIGVIVQKISPSNIEDRLRVVRVNSVFPLELARVAEAVGAKVIQIATDCVFSGSTGSYNENSLHDAFDLYGKSKSLGEVPSTHVMNLRCSIIGRELGTNFSLLEWVLAHERGATLTGYTDRIWNGVTTSAFGRIAAGVIRSSSFRPGVFHVVPADVVTKATLVELIAKSFGRDDLKIKVHPSGEHKDLSLTTLFGESNLHLWKQAGYSSIPSIEQMITDVSAIDR